MNREQAVEIIRESRLHRHTESVARQLLPSVRLIVQDDSTLKGSGFGISRLGGLPLLPAGIDWPRWDRGDYLRRAADRLEEKFRKNPRATGLRDIAARMRDDSLSGPTPLAFIGQLDLSELAATSKFSDWPNSGTLSFFYDFLASTWGFDPSVRDYFRVLYFSADAKLEQRGSPSDLPDVAKFHERMVAFHSEWTLPIYRAKRQKDPPWTDDDYRDLCSRLMPTVNDREPIHRCGGHPEQIQGDMRLECQLVTNGIYCGDSTGYSDPRAKQLSAGAADWQLLLQIDSDQTRLGWIWGDSGRVYFWARRQDIVNAAFEGSWAILQCY